MGKPQTKIQKRENKNKPQLTEDRVREIVREEIARGYAKALEKVNQNGRAKDNQV